MKKILILIFTFILIIPTIYGQSIQDTYLEQLNILKNSTTNMGSRRYIDENDTPSFKKEIANMVAYTDELYDDAKRDLPEGTSTENLFQSLYLITVLYYKSALQELLLYQPTGSGIDKFNSVESFFRFRYLADRNVYELNEIFKNKK